MTAARAVGAPGPPEGAGGPRLRVLVDEDPPFVIQAGDRFTGWAVDLWTEVARQAGLDWEIVGVAEPDEVVKALAAGNVDVGLGDIAVTKERADRIDFSHPYYHSDVCIVVRNDGRGRLMGALANLATPAHAGLLLAVLGLVLLMSASIYVLARRHQAASFPAGRAEGMVEAVYIAASALMKGQIDHAFLPGVRGRIVALAWMLLGTIIVAYVTATVAASLTVGGLVARIRDVHDLVGLPVAAIEGHETVRWLSHRGVAVVPRPDLDAAMAALVGGQVEAVVHDLPPVRWWRVNNPGMPVSLIGPTFDWKDYAVALRDGSPLRHRINDALLTLQESGFFEQLDQRWMGSGR